MENNRYNLDHNITLIEIDEDAANSCGNYVIKIQIFKNTGKWYQNRYFMLNGMSSAYMFELIKTNYSYAHQIYETTRDFFKSHLVSTFGNNSFVVVNCDPFVPYLLNN